MANLIHHLSSRTLCALIFLFISVSIVFAENTGILQGLVVDVEDGSPMIGVAVQLEGTTLGAASDLDGNYRIVNVPVGTYTVVVSAIGYAHLSVKGVTIDDGKSITQNLTLKTEALQLGEVVIEARQTNNTEAALLSIQKRAPSVSDGVSAEQIKKSPDSDASAAVKRVTGVTVIGDKYVYVRGMGERYNNTRLNGASIASPEPMKRTIPFDVIPANLLDNVIVSKTATPDQPGDFSGGSVQLNTREFPDKLTFSASATNAYNDQTSLKGFNSYQGGNKDWLGVDDGTRDIPGYVERGGWWNDIDMQRQAAQYFNKTWSPQTVSAPLNMTRSISFGNQSEVLRLPLGYLVSLNYADSYSRRIGQQNDYVPTTDSTGRSFYTQTEKLSVDRSIHSASWGGILDLNTKLSPNHKLSFKSLYTRSADDEARIAEGFIKVADYRSYRLTWTERSLLNTQLKGVDEFLSLGNSRLEWTGSYSRGTYDQPDRRDLYYVQSIDDNLWRYIPNGISGRRRFANMRDNVYEGSLDWSLPLDFLHSKSSKLKFGGLYRQLKRKFPTRTFYFSYETQPDVPQLDSSLPPQGIFTEQNVENYFYLDELTAALDSYNAEMKTGAAYVMGDIMATNRWRLIGGVRVEDTDQHYKTFPYQGGTQAEISEGGPKHTDVLPSLNVTYKVSDKLNLRAAASMTIANPDYAEIVPSEDQEFFEGAVRRGNPDLKYSKISNFDLRSDYYPGIGENVSLGVFYKDIRDPIEWVITSGASQPEMEPENFAHVHNLGAEFEFRKSLSMLEPSFGDWISYFAILGNTALISSNVDLTSEGQNILTNKTRPMMEQSKYVVNGALSFTHPRWGSDIRLLYNTFGKRISAVGALGFADTYEQPFDKLDLTCNQKAWNTLVGQDSGD